MKIYSRRLMIRVSEEQMKTIKKRCNDLHMSLSEYVRAKIFEPDEIGWKETKLKLKKWLVEEERK